MNDHVRGALAFARQVLPTGSRNLIAAHESYVDLLQKIIRPARDILHVHSLKGFHELRAAYAYGHHGLQPLIDADFTVSRCLWNPNWFRLISYRV